MKRSVNSILIYRMLCKICSQFFCFGIRLSISSKHTETTLSLNKALFNFWNFEPSRKSSLSKFLLFKFFYFPKKIEKCRWIYKTQNIFPENCWYVFLSQITPVSQEKGPHDRKADKKVLSYCEFDESCFCATMLITFVYRTEYIYICAIQAVRECRS